MAFQLIWELALWKFPSRSSMAVAEPAVGYLGTALALGQR